jgi:hypothetical protein
MTDHLLDDDPVLDRRAVAAYIDFAPKTLTIWDSTKRFDLKPFKDGRFVKYRLSSINRFLVQHGKRDNGNRFDPVLRPKRAAKYIDRSPRTLEEREYIERHKLEVVKIGRSVRYALSSLDEFLDAQMRPY